MREQLKQAYNEIKNQQNLFINKDNFDKKKQVIENIWAEKPNKKFKLTVNRVFYLLALLEPQKDLADENKIKHDNFCRALIAYLNKCHHQLFEDAIIKAFVGRSPIKKDVHAAAWKYLDIIEGFQPELGKKLFDAAKDDLDFNCRKVIKNAPDAIKESIIPKSADVLNQRQKPENAVFSHAIKSSPDMAQALLENRSIDCQASESMVSNAIREKKINQAGAKNFLNHKTRFLTVLEFMGKVFAKLPKIRRSTSNNPADCTLAKTKKSILQRIQDKINERKTAFINAVKTGLQARSSDGVQVLQPGEEGRGKAPVLVASGDAHHEGGRKSENISDKIFEQQEISIPESEEQDFQSNKSCIFQ